MPEWPLHQETLHPPLPFDIYITNVCLWASTARHQSLLGIQYIWTKERCLIFLKQVRKNALVIFAFLHGRVRESTMIQSDQIVSNFYIFKVRWDKSVCFTTESQQKKRYFKEKQTRWVGARNASVWHSYDKKLIQRENEYKE